MANILGFTKRLTGPHHINWTQEDLDRLRKIYGLTEKQAAAAVSKHVATMSVQTLPPITKSAGDLPVRWSFTASDGKVDRVGDLVDIAGIDLTEYRSNPIWHHQHDFSLPIGRSASIEKVNGKLKSVLELGIDVFPFAPAVQKMLAGKMLNACSIGFTPKRWTYDKARDGITFHEISLFEISTCGVPCCAGAVLDGPVKSLSEQAAQYRREVAEHKADLKRQYEKRKADLIAGHRKAQR